MLTKGILEQGTDITQEGPGEDSKSRSGLRAGGLWGYTKTCKILVAVGAKRGKKKPAPWDATSVRALRRYLGLSQDALAEELGTRQQTVSEWETGRYRPRGASARLLSIVAERAGFAYDASGAGGASEGKTGEGAGG